MHIVIVAGESSGDQLGEGLVAKLKSAYPEATINGIAGPLMQKAGCQSLFPMETLSVMGLVEVLKNLPAILKIRFHLLKYLKTTLPDIYIGIDAPDFNLPVEKQAKKKGIKVVHYVSPSVWAWREGRIKTIKAATDVVLAILPFEEAFYQKHHHRAVFVGHPLANKIPLEPDKCAARKQLQLTGDDVMVGLLPGSRKQEVERLLEPFLQGLMALESVLDKRFKIIIPVAKPSLKSTILGFVHKYQQLNIQLVDAQAHIVLEASDYVLLASGTAALEAMLYKRPMVMAYKLSLITYGVAKLMVKKGFYSLPNILAGKALIPELIQNEVTAKHICDALFQLMTNDEHTQAVIKQFYDLHRSLRLDADQKALEVVASLIPAP